MISIDYQVLNINAVIQSRYIVFLNLGGIRLVLYIASIYILISTYNVYIWRMSIVNEPCHLTLQIHTICLQSPNKPLSSNFKET